MKTSVTLAAAILLSLPIASTFLPHLAEHPKAVSAMADQETIAPQRPQAAAEPNACAPPNRIVGSVEETIWRLMIAATCPVNDDRYPYVVWENWIEQTQMFPRNPQRGGLRPPNTRSRNSSVEHGLHASPLALAINPGLESIVPGQLGAPDTNCNHAGDPPPNQPNLMFCEEVRLNGATEDYIAGTNLWNRDGQARAAAMQRDIEFPKAAVEIKADWIPLSTIGLDCNNLPRDLTTKVHVEVIQGNCYALAGMHLTSKIEKDWIWGTFEPQYLTTNPNRCKVLGCTDPFGSKPAQTGGTPTRLSERLSNLMAAANLAPEWRNYRMDGAQSFFTEGGQPTLLGNSIIEGENANLPLTQSSCITCHALSSIKNDGTDGITLLGTQGPVGTPQALPSKEWVFRDFVWSMLLACPDGTQKSCKNPQ